MAHAASPHDLQVTRLDHAIMYLHPARTAPTRHTPSRRRTCHHKPWPQCRLCGHQTAGTTALAMHPSAGCAHSPLPYRTGSAYHQRADVRSTRRAARSWTWCWKLRRCLRRLRICGPRTRRATRRLSYATEEERLHTRTPLPYTAGPFVRSPDRGTTALVMPPSAGRAHSPLPYRTGSAHHQRADVRNIRRAALSWTWCWKLRRCLRRLRICGPRTRRATRRPSYATETEEERLHTRTPLPYAAGPFVRSPDRRHNRPRDASIRRACPLSPTPQGRSCGHRTAAQPPS
jgi:hypothetical protein